MLYLKVCKIMGAQVTCISTFAAYVGPRAFKSNALIANGRVTPVVFPVSVLPPSITTVTPSERENALALVIGIQMRLGADY